MMRKLFVGVLAVGLGLALWHQQTLTDWWFLRNYQPSSQIAALADAVALSEHGRRLFYVADPIINDDQDFNDNCREQAEATLVLGCYADGRIYVLNVERDELEGVEEVTAAHEMLHSAYDRLSGDERRRIDRLLNTAYESTDNAKLKDLIAEYEQSGGEAVRRNELHSIFATQVSELSPQLEEYFSQYFSDRQAVVGLYQQYEAVFNSINQEISYLKQTITGLRDQADTLEGQIADQKAALDTLNRRLSQLEEQGDNEQYNDLVPQQNQDVRTYNSLAARYRGVIAVHNQRVDEVNDLVLLQNDLVNSLDSTVEPL